MFVLGLRMMRLNKKKIVGAIMCVAAFATAAGGWTWASTAGRSYTDNAYLRGDITPIAPKVLGYVTEVKIEDNQEVHTGDVLFRIDDRDYRARLAQAIANVDAAIAQISNVDAEIKLQRSLVRQAEAQRLTAAAERDFAAKVNDRRRDLVKSDAVSREQVDETDAARSRAEAGLAAANATVEAQKLRIDVLVAQREAARAAVAQAEAVRDLARIDLDNTIIRAPVAGVVGNRQVRVGRLVSPGLSLLDIVPVHDLWVVANFKESQIQGIHPGQRVRITVDAFPDRSFDGVVDSFAPGSGSAFSLLPVDNATGNFVRVVQRVPVKIRITSNPATVPLAPGLSAHVRVIRGSGA